jgi:hypothetical protein
MVASHSLHCRTVHMSGAQLIWPFREALQPCSGESSGMVRRSDGYVIRLKHTLAIVRHFYEAMVT